MSESGDAVADDEKVVCGAASLPRDVEECANYLNEERKKMTTLSNVYLDDYTLVRKCPTCNEEHARFKAKVIIKHLDINVYDDRCGLCKRNLPDLKHHNSSLCKIKICSFCKADYQREEDKMTHYRDYVLKHMCSCGTFLIGGYYANK